MILKAEEQIGYMLGKQIWNWLVRRILWMIGIFSRPMSWQWYRDFFSLSYLRYMATWFALVPVAALALSSVPEQITVPFLQPPLVLKLALPFSWQVLWLGSLAFVAAFTVYLLRAPTFVRRYHSLDDYLAKGHSPRWISWEAKTLYEWNSGRSKFLERMTQKNYVSLDVGAAPPTGGEVVVNGPTSDFRFSHAGNHYVLAMPILDKDGLEDAALTAIAVREIFWEIFARYAESRVVARRIMISCLLLALGCVLLVVGQHIFATFPYFFLR